MSTGPTALSVGRGAEGYVVRVCGRGTMRESRMLHDYLGCVLGQPDSRVTIDLAGCDYLDSTFLGCLCSWKKQHGAERFAIAAPPEKVQSLLMPLKLHLFLTIVPTAPAVEGNLVAIEIVQRDACDLGRHVMECHRRLAELGGPQQEAFTRIADGLEKDLNRNRTSESSSGQSVPS